MKFKTSKEKLSKVINKRYTRISNYLKKQTKTKDMETNHINVAITYTLHKIYLNTLTNNENVEYLLNELSNYIETNYINLLEENKTTIEYIKEISNEIYNKYNNEETLLTINNKDIADILSKYKDLSNIDNLSTSIINTYNAIEKNYKYIELI